MITIPLKKFAFSLFYQVSKSFCPNLYLYKSPLEFSKHYMLCFYPCFYLCILCCLKRTFVVLSWVGTIMGEYLSSSAGLGYLIVYGSQIFKIDLVMTSTVLLCVLAGLMYFAICLIEKWRNR